MLKNENYIHNLNYTARKRIPSNMINFFITQVNFVLYILSKTRY